MSDTPIASRSVILRQKCVPYSLPDRDMRVITSDRERIMGYTLLCDITTRTRTTAAAIRVRIIQTRNSMARHGNMGSDLSRKQYSNKCSDRMSAGWKYGTYNKNNSEV